MLARSRSRETLPFIFVARKDKRVPFRTDHRKCEAGRLFPTRNFFCPVPVRMIACFVFLRVRRGFDAPDECTMNDERNCDHNRDDVLKKLFSL
jgi:hypothetical protein